MKTMLYTMIEVCIFNKSNNVLRFDIFKKSSLSVSTPRYLWHAARKQMQSIRTCLTVRGGWQIWHSCWFSPFRRYALVSLVWPIWRQLIRT